MKKNTEPLQPGTFYHIYNRGNNKEKIFKEARNYAYFLKLFHKYISPVADTYAYCLLGNHFHFLIRTKGEDEIHENLNVKGVIAGRNRTPLTLEGTYASKLISNQFAKLFNSYTQSINKAYGRTGSLFENPFRRISVESDAYLSRLIAYIHRNPQKHGLIEDFTQYPHSSYQSHRFLEKPTKLRRDEVLKWFGDAQKYQSFHKIHQEEDGLKKYVIEFD